MTRLATPPKTKEWILETDRLAFRHYEISDLAKLIELRADPDVNRYLGGVRMQNPEALAKRIRFYMSCYENHGFGMCPMIVKETGEVIGTAGLQPLDGTDDIEVGYSLAPEHWGLGIGTEAAIAWIDYGFFEKGLDRIAGVATVENGASRHILEKLGMRYENTESHFDDERAFYAISRTEFLSRKASDRP
ncbi:GNAT family N-acetyltransferase [soil metagenome]